MLLFCCRVRVVTWNIAGKHPKEDLTNLLGLISEKDTTDAEFSESAQSHRSNETDGNKVSRQAVAEADLILIGCVQSLSSTSAVRCKSSGIFGQVNAHCRQMSEMSGEK